jgi:protein PhnA
MKIEQMLSGRSGDACELCKSKDNLEIYETKKNESKDPEYTVLLCEKCRNQLDKKSSPDIAHWKFLSETIWSELPPIQVISWRMLNRLRDQSWAMDLLDMMYLDDETLSWAKETGDHENDSSVDLHKDVNGHQLFNGDTVVLIKSLDVKGSTLTARLGTVVKNIRLVENNTDQVEGKVEGQQIVILTKYLRKQGAGQDE